jgi:hypothetical protein
MQVAGRRCDGGRGVGRGGGRPPTLHGRWQRWKGVQEQGVQGVQGDHPTRRGTDGHRNAPVSGIPWHQITMVRGRGVLFPDRSGPDRGDPALSECRIRSIMSCIRQRSASLGREAETYETLSNGLLHLSLVPLRFVSDFNLFGEDTTSLGQQFSGTDTGCIGVCLLCHLT